jgi:hypothetical protein
VTDDEIVRPNLPHEAALVKDQHEPPVPQAESPEAGRDLPRTPGPPKKFNPEYPRYLHSGPSMPANAGDVRVIDYLRYSLRISS